MDPIRIDTRMEYDYCLARHFQPLIDRRFEMSNELRVSIQRELFGDGHSPAENEKFYRWCWNHLPHICEECLRPLDQYSATYVSHILTRGAHPAQAHDPRNVNILCFKHHSVWENGDKESMRIYRKNLATIEELKKDYGEL